MLRRLFSGRNLMFLVGGATLAAFGLAGFTLLLLVDKAPWLPSTPQNVVLSLNANLVVVAILALLIGYRVISLFVRGRRGGGGAHLHRRVAVLFGLVATAPSIMLVVFSIAFLHVGLEQWFGEKVEAAVGRSVSIARAYLREHSQGLVRDTYGFGAMLEYGAELDYPIDSERVTTAVNSFVVRYGLSGAAVFDEAGNVQLKAGDTSEMEDVFVPAWALHSAKQGDQAVVFSGGRERIYSLLWVKEVSRYLLVGRAIDAGISGHVEGVNRAVGAYKEAIDERGSIEVRLSILYLLFGLAFVLASVWAGLMFAGALAEPISNLIRTADKVGAGDLSARAAVGERSGEIGNLLIGFNRMTAQLERQREELIEANTEMDERRRFTAAVLTGVTSGVIGLDDNGVIRAANRYAEDALAVGPGGLIGLELAQIAPELEAVLSGRSAQETEVRLVRAGRQRVLLVRASAGGEDHAGLVITFTDIADLLAAKRQAAWSGVARRVAHEIKNPLTPIQLAAERLKRRYTKKVEDDPETFALLCDTIVRQVAALRGMVDEFSEFARLPTPAMQSADLEALCQEVIALLGMQYPDVTFELDAGSGLPPADCDPGQITRALTNVIINAVHAVQENGGGDGAARIVVAVRQDGERVVATVEDNGGGFPEDMLENVTDPYVTTKENGSGLGLAIVRRILEEHGGALALWNRPEGGAAVELRLWAHGDMQLAEAGE